MHAWRVARAHTGKMEIVKFEGQYHGWADEQKVTIGADTLEELRPEIKHQQVDEYSRSKESIQQMTLSLLLGTMPNLWKRFWTLTTISQLF